MHLRNLNSTEARILIECYPEVTEKEEIEKIINKWDERKGTPEYLEKVLLGKEIYKIVSCLSHLYESSCEFIENGNPEDLFKINPESRVWIEFNYDKKLLYVYTQKSNIIPVFKVYISDDTKKSFDTLAFYFTPTSVINYVKISDAIIIKNDSIKYYDEMIKEEVANELGFQK